MCYYRIDRFKITHFHKRCENYIEEKFILTTKFKHSEGLHTSRGRILSEVNTNSWTALNSLFKTFLICITEKVVQSLSISASFNMSPPQSSACSSESQFLIRTRIKTILSGSIFTILQFQLNTKLLCLLGHMLHTL